MTHSLPLLRRIWLDLATSRKKQSWFWQFPSLPHHNCWRGIIGRGDYWAVDLYIQIETFTFCAILVKTDQISLIFCLFMLSFETHMVLPWKWLNTFFFSFEPSKRVWEHFILIGLFNFGLHFGRFFSFNSVFFPLIQ